MPFVPYLHFQGDCAEAMNFYKDVFGGTDLQVMTYAEAPQGVVPEGTAHSSSRVMHATLTVPGGSLLASDFPPGMDGEAQKAVSVAWSVEAVDAGRALFDKLAAGGFVVVPYSETFWAKGFGMVRDRFGTHWMISGPAQPGMG